MRVLVRRGMNPRNVVLGATRLPEEHAIFTAKQRVVHGFRGQQDPPPSLPYQVHHLVAGRNRPDCCGRTTLEATNLL